MRSDKKSPERVQRRRVNEPLSLGFLVIAISLFIITVAGSYIYFKTKVAFKPPATYTGPTKSDTKKKDALEDLPHKLYTDGIQKPNGDTGISETSTIVMIEDAIRDYIRVYGVNLLDLYIDSEGIVYIDLSNDIRKNFHGDVTEEYNLISGLYNSIKKSAPDVSAIKILIDGNEIESIGGHIDVSKPIGGGSEENTNRYL